MRDEVFEKLSLHDKLTQIRKNQKDAIWYQYLLFVGLVILISVLGASIMGMIQ